MNLLKLVEQEDLAYDLVQEIFMKFIKNIDKYQIKGPATLGTYLISIAKNTYIDYLRKNKNIILDEKVELWSDDDSMHQNMILNQENQIISSKNSFLHQNEIYCPRCGNKVKEEH